MYTDLKEKYSGNVYWNNSGHEFLRVAGYIDANENFFRQVKNFDRVIVEHYTPGFNWQNTGYLTEEDFLNSIKIRRFKLIKEFNGELFKLYMKLKKI